MLYGSCRVLSSSIAPSIMCNSTSQHCPHASDTKQDSRTGRHHVCKFKILKCSIRQLCALCFILYNLGAGNYCEAKLASTVSQDSLTPANNQTMTDTVGQSPTDRIETNSKWNVQCNNRNCFLKISSSKQVLEKMTNVSAHLFDFYATENGTRKYLTEAGLDRLLENLRKKDSREGHDHDHEEHEHDNHEFDLNKSDHLESEASNGEEDNDSMWDNLSLEELIFYWELQEYPCYTSAKELAKAYFNPSNGDLQLTFQDFMTLLPQIVLDVIRPECKQNVELNKENEQKNVTKGGVEHSTSNIWLISFGSVFVISLISLLGVATIPLLRHSKALLNNIVSFLVALAVGTLAGDALLHLLPKATGLHNCNSSGPGYGQSSDHDHNKEESDHFECMWMGLIACVGIYVFYLLETIMGFIRQKRKSRKRHSHCHNNQKKHNCDDESPTPSSKRNSKLNGGPLPEILGGSPLLSSPDEKAVRKNGVGPDHSIAIQMNGQLLETGHHHHHHHEVPQTIANIAWMVIVGDGLHNFTDGLAIGAAFTSSIGVGISTALAIFFHEIPQELGDFAMLLNAGMTVKQALFWNFLSACTCFAGLIIGLIVGEFTTGIILWILAFTAGGFLYIALVDMLPGMISQLSHKDFCFRFAIQNVGMTTGFAIMVLVAVLEDSFQSYFT